MIQTPIICTLYMERSHFELVKKYIQTHWATKPGPAGAKILLKSAIFMDLNFASQSISIQQPTMVCKYFSPRVCKIELECHFYPDQLQSGCLSEAQRELMPLQSVPPERGTQLSDRHILSTKKDLEHSWHSANMCGWIYDYQNCQN